MSDLSIRSRSRDLLLSSLQSGLSAAGEVQDLPSDTTPLTHLAESIEAAIFEAHSADTGNEYRDAVRQRALVLKKDNPELARRLVEGGLSPQGFASADASSLKSPEQTRSDAELQQHNIQQAIGLSNNNADDAGADAEAAFQPARPVSPSQVSSGGAAPGQDGFMPPTGQVGATEAMLGGEGEFAARQQPKVGRAMEGIEFETP